MAKKPLVAKPGTQKGVFKPDNIESYTVYENMPTTLLDMLYAVMPERKKTTVKDFLKHRQVMVGENVITQFDHPVCPGVVSTLSLCANNSAINPTPQK